MDITEESIGLYVKFEDNEGPIAFYSEEYSYAFPEKCS